MYEKIEGKLLRFALPSMYNYLYAILALLRQKDFSAFKDWRLDVYSKLKKSQLTLTNEEKRVLFEQFFFTYKLMSNIEYLKDKDRQVQIPFVQMAGMAFYYAAYSLANIYIFCNNKSITENHAGTVRQFNEFCDILAFPFNVTGRYEDGGCKNFNLILGREEFNKDFSYDTQVLRRKSLSEFDYRSAVLSYLSGTQIWYWDSSSLKKEALRWLRDNGLDGFRKKDARVVRDEKFAKLPNVNFLTCLYRLRGKVNYRDSLFSLYDLEGDAEFNSFEKAEKLPEIMIGILKYFSVDVEAYLKVRLASNPFHEQMLLDMIDKTNAFQLAYPEFQKNIFYPD